MKKLNKIFEIGVKFNGHKCPAILLGFWTSARYIRPPVNKSMGIFTAKRCAVCGELTFVNKLRITEDNQLVCIPFSGYGG